MSGRERIVKRYVLTAVTRCQHCGRHFTADDVQIVSQDVDFFLTLVSCPACQTRGLVATIVKEGAMPRQVSDLTDRDRERLSAAPVSTDDVLSVHDSLTDFGGDFTTLFARRP